MRRLETDAGASASEADDPVVQLEKEWSAAFLRHDRAAVARIVDPGDVLVMSGDHRALGQVG
jgi:hypothetical protein